MMRIKKIKNRGVLFTHKTSSGWDLNMYLIRGNRYNFIVDTGLGSLNIAPVKEYIRNDGKPVIVINTHYHWDHVWGNKSLQECTIISHKLCRDLIESNWEDMLEKNRHYVEGEAEIRLPDLVFEKELYFPDDRVKIIYTPGHTIDSASVLDEEDKILHAGDNIGDTEEEIVPSIYSEKAIYIDTLQKYREMDFDTCVSGHNTVLGKEVIERILQQAGLQS